jgi:hypothetical protein
MTNYYVEDNGRIVIYNSKKYKVENTLECMPQYAELPIQKTTKDIVEFEGKFYFEDDEEYIAQKEAEERERIQALSMTRSDFFDNTIKAWGADSNDLLPIIEGILNTLPISDIEKKIAINNYNNALNFYRKHTLFTLLSGVPITIGENTIIITEAQWDSFFDEVSKRNPEAYKKLLPDLAS